MYGHYTRAKKFAYGRVYPDESQSLWSTQWPRKWKYGVNFSFVLFLNKQTCALRSTYSMCRRNIYRERGSRILLLILKYEHRMIRTLLLEICIKRVVWKYIARSTYSTVQKYLSHSFQIYSVIVKFVFIRKYEPVYYLYLLQSCKAISSFSLWCIGHEREGWTHWFMHLFCN